MSQINQKSRKYQKIGYETRKQIIELIVNQGKNLIEIAEHYDISTSTVRAIVKSYEQKGRIFETKEDQMRRLLLEKFKKQSQKPPETSQKKQEQFYCMFIPNYECPQLFYVPNFMTYDNNNA